MSAAEPTAAESAPPHSPLLARRGAVSADGPDFGVASHYGDPLAEQRAVAAGWGIVDNSHRSVLRIDGEDRLAWLHSLTTQRLEALTPGLSAQALVLSPQGHVEYHLTLTDDGTCTWLHTEPGSGSALLAFLDSMRFMLRVHVRDATGEFAVLRLLGPASGAALAARAIRLDGALGPEFVVPRTEFAATVTDLLAQGAVLAGMWCQEALRIAIGQPRLGIDTDHRTIPHEVGWIGTAVHLDKGCYRGQETVARVQNLGHPPRRLVRLLLDGSEDRLPEHGDRVFADGSPVGFAGSAARHYELGPVALALIKRTAPTDATLQVAGIAATQEVIVAPDVGASVRVTLKRDDLLRRSRE